MKCDRSKDLPRREEAISMADARRSQIADREPSFCGDEPVELPSQPGKRQGSRRHSLLGGLTVAKKKAAKKKAAPKKKAAKKKTAKKK